MQKIDHASHPITVFYRNSITENELYSYLFNLTYEYKKRFGKAHQNSMFLVGYMECMSVLVSSLYVEKLR